MRIISGKYKGRMIHPPKRLPVRPTTDFAKESLFNILNNQIDFESTKVLDLFCGTGNIAYEFISRGCPDITCIDINYECCNFVKKTFQELSAENAKVIKMNVFSFLKNNLSRYDLVFADPPYDLPELKTIPDLVFENKMLNEGGIFILEHGEYNDFTLHPHFKEHRKYGNVNFTFFSSAPAAE